MTRSNEILLGKIAVRMNLLTEEKLEQCIRIQQSSKGSHTLGEILLKKGYLTKPQLKKILEVQKRAMDRKERITQKRLEDVIFGKILIQKSLCSKQDLNLAVREQANLKEKGIVKRLGEILVEKGILLPSQVEEVLRSQDKDILVCDQCLSQFNVASFEDGQVVKCTKCGYPLSQPNKLYSIAVDEATTLVGAWEDDDKGLVSATADKRKAATEENLSGRVIGGCKINEKLGQGGMGAVYRAHHVGLDKPVAFKVLPVRYTDDASFVERFSREARSAAKLEHPNIVQVLNVGLEMIDGQEYHYIVMQYVEGKTVEDIIRQRRRLKVDEATRVIREAAKGLAAAHARKIIHRDIKPDNIMITTEGMVKVTDFGLARSTEAPSDITQDGQVMGTPFFMSPEQADNEETDGRSDLYSLGVTYYYMITGEKPFVAETPLQVMMKHIKEPFRFPARFQETIPMSTQRVIEKLLAKDPAERYQTAKDLIRALDRILKGEDITAPIDVRHASMSQSSGAGARVVMYGALVLILAGLVFVLWQLQSKLSGENQGPGTVVKIGSTDGGNGAAGSTAAAQAIRQEANRLVDQEMYVSAWVKFDEFRKTYGTTDPNWTALKQDRNGIRPKLVADFDAAAQATEDQVREGRFAAATDALEKYRNLDDANEISSRADERIAEIRQAKEDAEKALADAKEEAAVKIADKDYDAAQDIYVKIQARFDAYHAEQALRIEADKLVDDMSARNDFGKDAALAEQRIAEERPGEAIQMMERYEDSAIADIETEAERIRDRAQAWIEYLPERKRAESLVLDEEKFSEAEAKMQPYQSHGDSTIVSDASRMIRMIAGARAYGEELEKARVLIRQKKDYSGALTILETYAEAGEVEPLRARAKTAAEALQSLIRGVRYDELGHHQRALGLIDVAAQSKATLVAEEAREVHALVKDRFEKSRLVGTKVVANGEFPFGSDRNPMERPARRVNLPTYHIDEHEVTVAEYARFLEFMVETGDHTTCHPQEGAEKSHAPDAWDEQRSRPDHPIVGVDWYDAFAFAAWSGKRLPTEAEWEKAARGEEGRLYPWGDRFDDTLCNARGKGAVPVGSYPLGGSSFGVLDLAGNVWEWTESPDPGYKASQGAPPGPRPIRGGGWQEDDVTRSLATITTVRFLEDPLARRADLGFRCAMDE